MTMLCYMLSSVDPALDNMSFINRFVSCYYGANKWLKYVHYTLTVLSRLHNNYPERSRILPFLTCRFSRISNHAFCFRGYNNREVYVERNDTSRCKYHSRAVAHKCLDVLLELSWFQPNSPFTMYITYENESTSFW